MMKTKRLNLFWLMNGGNSSQNLKLNGEPVMHRISLNYWFSNNFFLRHKNLSFVPPCTDKQRKQKARNRKWISRHCFASLFLLMAKDWIQLLSWNQELYLLTNNIFMLPGVCYICIRPHSMLSELFFVTMLLILIYCLAFRVKSTWVGPLLIFQSKLKKKLYLPKNSEKSFIFLFIKKNTDSAFDILHF